MTAGSSDFKYQVVGNWSKRLKEEGEFPELADISNWTKLKETDNTENFIQRLIARAHRGNF